MGGGVFFNHPSHLGLLGSQKYFINIQLSVICSCLRDGACWSPSQWTHTQLIPWGNLESLINLMGTFLDCWWKTRVLGEKSVQTQSEHTNSCWRTQILEEALESLAPVSPLRPVKMVKMVESKMTTKQNDKNNSTVLFDCETRTRPSVPPLYLMTSEIWGIPPEAPRVQIALIACCILMLLQMKRSRAGWCLTADNRLGRRGEGPRWGKW